MPTLAARLPRFPWDALEPYQAKALAHPGGIVDLSIGTPVDPVPDVVREALAAASDAPGYPATAGTRALRQAAAGWLARRHQVTVDPDAVLPVIGTKELIAGLPTLLGLRPGRRGRASRARLPDLRRGRADGRGQAGGRRRAAYRSAPSRSGWSG